MKRNMPAVHDPTGLCVSIHAAGTADRLYVSNEVNNQLHFRINDENCWVRVDDLAAAINMLLPTKGKHADKEDEKNA